ncbi:ComF family protein [Anaerolentibacter hominis]|uniref:ComF family protein n=1 Tax=Anaerolentibacter hominis TaxID=3079009 RepID=UPI0031B89AD1
MVDRLRNLSIINWIYPRICPVCGEIVPVMEGRIHTECQGRLIPVGEPSCCKCGKPLERQEQEYCYDCLRKGHSYERGFALWRYDCTAREAIAAFKYRGKQEFAEFFADELVRQFGPQLRKTGAQAFIPVPVHTSRLKSRGYNQAGLLADALGKRLDIPVVSDYLYRQKKTEPQKGLNDRERLRNLLQAFAVDGDKQKRFKDLKRVILVDDIYTTGSTIEACTRVLRQAGVAHVYYVSLCIGSGI